MVEIPLFVFCNKPYTNLEKMDNRVVIDHRNLNGHELCIDNECLRWKRSSIYVDKLVCSTYTLDSLIFMNKYIFGKPWYDILHDCNVDLKWS